MSTESEPDAVGGAIWFYAALGSLFSALAIVSLAQKIFAIGLAPTMQEVVDFYRGVVHPVTQLAVQFAQAVFPRIHLPEAFKDIFAVSFVFGSAYARASYLRSPLGVSYALLYAVVALLLTLSLLSFVVFLIVIVQSRRPVNETVVYDQTSIAYARHGGTRLRPKEEIVADRYRSRAVARATVILASVSLLAAAVFFAVNSQL